MIPKTYLALSTLALLSLTNVQANLKSCNVTGNNCTGYFYEDINAAFVDCFDMNGVIISREEEFFTSQLHKRCNSTTFSELVSSLNGALTMVNLSSAANVSYCDYYEVGKGYEFT
jgi:hypothetical protein